MGSPESCRLSGAESNRWGPQKAADGQGAAAASEFITHHLLLFLRNSSLMICMVALALFALSCSKTKGHASIGDRAPDFTLRDLNGNKIQLSELTGKVVMVEFWATWCPPCRESIPEMKDVYEKYKDRGFVLLGISIDKGKNAPVEVSSFVKEHSVTYPVLIDDSDVNASYSVSSIPTSFIIDKEGKIVSKRTGFIPGLGGEISKEIEALL